MKRFLVTQTIEQSIVVEAESEDEALHRALEAAEWDISTPHDTRVDDIS